jgi:hypothetical protein
LSNDLNSRSWFQDVFAGQENDFVGAAHRFVAAGSNEVYVVHSVSRRRQVSTKT